MTRNETVEAWARSRKADGGTIHTNGLTLKSYAMVIGYTTAEGEKVVLDSPVSTTTTRHINSAKRVADSVLHVSAHKTACGYPCNHTPNPIDYPDWKGN